MLHQKSDEHINEYNNIVVVCIILKWVTAK